MKLPALGCHNNYYPVTHKKRLDMPADGEWIESARANDERAAKWQRATQLLSLYVFSAAECLCRFAPRAPPAIIKPLIKIHNTDGWGLLSLWTFPGGVHRRVKAVIGMRACALPPIVCHQGGGSLCSAAMLWRIMCSTVACCCLNCVCFLFSQQMPSAGAFCGQYRRLSRGD